VISLIRRLFQAPIAIYRSVFHRSHPNPFPDNQLTADIDKLDQQWRQAEKVRSRQLAASTKGGRG